jgi:mono/diheme cytochrome c family protein
MLYSPGSRKKSLGKNNDMKSLRIGLITAALTLIGIACAGPARETTNRSQPTLAASPVATATPDAMAAARANFEKHCAVCHGEKGEGGIVKIDNATLKVPSLTKGHALTHKDEQLAKQIANGHEEMPAFKDKLTQAEIYGLVNFIRKELQGK